MALSFPSHLRPAKRFFLGLLAIWCVLVVFWVNRTVAALQAGSPANAPFGVFVVNGEIRAQDFSYNMLYFDGIRQRLIAHPYRMVEQVTLIHRLLPFSTSGMTHAYSPVAFTLAQPLLLFNGQARFLIYTLLCAVGTVLLFHYVLLPRVDTINQLLALAVCVTSICVFLSFTLGQSSLITTVCLGVFWALLRDRNGKTSLPVDLALALFFWALCLKPSVAIIPAMLLLGARAWRPLILGGALLLVTWSCVAGYYGGWWTGLTDYLHLLNHYNGEEMPVFMHRESGPATFFSRLDPDLPIHLFTAEKSLILISSAVLLLLRWTGRLTGSGHFQAMMATFLLVSPYLLPSEDWILCLLVVEGAFFRTERIAWGKILILFGIMNFRVGLTFPIDVNYELRVLFFAWMLFEAYFKAPVSTPTYADEPLPN